MDTFPSSFIVCLFTVSLLLFCCSINGLLLNPTSPNSCIICLLHSLSSSHYTLLSNLPSLYSCHLTHLSLFSSLTPLCTLAISIRHCSWFFCCHCYSPHFSKDTPKHCITTVFISVQLHLVTISLFPNMLVVL